jgi:hypothetical protein
MAFSTGLKSWKILFSMYLKQQITFPERAKTALSFKRMYKDLDK